MTPWVIVSATEIPHTKEEEWLGTTGRVLCARHEPPAAGNAPFPVVDPPTRRYPQCNARRDEVCVEALVSVYYCR